MSSPFASRPFSRLPVTLLWVVSSVALEMILMVGLVGIVPGFRRTFDEFGVQLPWATRLVIGVSEWHAAYWYFVEPLKLLVLIGGVLAGRHLFDTTWRGNVFGAVCLFLLAGALVFTIAGIALPYSALVEGMAK